MMLLKYKCRYRSMKPWPLVQLIRDWDPILKILNFDTLVIFFFLANERADLDPVLLPKRKYPRVYCYPRENTLVFPTLSWGSKVVSVIAHRFRSVTFTSGLSQSRWIRQSKPTDRFWQISQLTNTIKFKHDVDESSRGCMRCSRVWMRCSRV